MILFISFFFALFFGVIIVYNKLSSLSVRFLCGTFVFWCVSIGCLLLFLSKQSYYWGAVNRIFFITPFMWNMLLKYISAGSDVFIRGMNIGAAGFYYCSLCYSIAFTQGSRERKKRLFILLLPLFLLEAVLFDPGLHKWVQGVISSETVITYEAYTLIFKWIQECCRLLNLGSCLLVAGMLLHYYVSHPKVRFLKRYALLQIACVFPVIFMFEYSFWWYPDILVKATMKKGYYNYLLPDLSVGLLNSGWFYVALTAAYAVLLVFLFKYKAIEDYYKKDKQNIRISMDTASLGINTFTHAVKNHIQGIRSEAEFLSRRYPEETELLDSTRCILNSCEMCFATIEHANKQMKKHSLQMTLLPYSRIIEDAFAVLDGDVSNIEIMNNHERYMAYMDEHAMTEVLVNLIGNAREAIAGIPDGKICISIIDRGKWNGITVEDNGSGIAEENLGRIFTPFFSTKSTVHNWGMGLAFCYQVVTAHDGRITVDSTLGKGSVFTIMLPYM